MNPRCPKINPDAITSRRIDAGLSQAGLARKVGCTRQLLSGAERGANGLSLDVVGLIAEVLGCPVRRLLLPEPDDESGTPSARSVA